jgi:polar amino acid transport system permease protein
MYDFDFGSLAPYVPAFVRGVQITCWLTVVSSMTGTALGVPIALIMRTPRWLAVPIALIVDVIRAIPNLVLILFM